VLRQFYGEKATNLSSRDRVLLFMDTNFLNTKFARIGARLKPADHATITLQGWHRVLMNTEGQSKAMRNVAFLD